MARQVYANNVDTNGKVFETVGENIRNGARAGDLLILEKIDALDTKISSLQADVTENKSGIKKNSDDIDLLKEDIVDLESVIYVENIDEMIANSLISSTSDMTFVGNDFTLTNISDGVFGFETGHNYKMVLIPTASDVYADIKVLDGYSGTYIATLFKSTDIAKDNAVVIDIPNTINWNDNIRIIFQNSDTYITKGKLYIYDVTNLPENVIEKTDFTKCTNPLHIEVLSISNENAKSIVNYDNWYKGKKLTTFGDSITEQNLWQSFVKDKILFATIVNKGVSGTSISGTINNAMWQNSRINALPLDTDVLTIMGGTNDSASSVNIGDISITNHDTNTFVGAYNVLISKLLYKFYNLSSGKYSDINYSGLIKSVKFKDIVIYIMTPPFNANTQYSGENSARLKAIADATKDVAKMWGIPCIDIYYNSGINTENVNALLQDGIHPNNLGAKKIASVVVNGMKSHAPIN